VEAELFGQVSEEKEANAFVGGCKEAKHLRAYATYQILARGVTFRDHMSTLLQPVRYFHVSRICIKRLLIAHMIICGSSQDAAIGAGQVSGLMVKGGSPR
jgi:hypothetical protein